MFVGLRGAFLTGAGFGDTGAAVFTISAMQFIWGFAQPVRPIKSSKALDLRAFEDIQVWKLVRLLSLRIMLKCLIRPQTSGAQSCLFGRATRGCKGRKRGRKDLKKVLIQLR